MDRKNTYFGAKRGLVRARARGPRRILPRRMFASYRTQALFSLLLSFSILCGGCFEREKGEPFYGRVVVPRAQEFRWSDGGLPRIFDPARAAVPPDTDVVRALYEGLTDYEPSTLRPVPAVASRWESSEGGRKWTFHLRRDARWSNGDQVTAQDFVRSWQRTLRLGERSPHAKLLSIIEGASAPSSQGGAVAQSTPGGAAAAATSGRGGERASVPSPARKEFGAVALDSHTLSVTLQRPDRNFPALAAHPVFRPVHELSLGAEPPLLTEEQFNEGGGLGIVTNGAFNLSRLGGDSVVLERAASYWDADSVSLERVSFVDKGDAEETLAAYRAGEVDAVTNTQFEPLAVKLLTPYKDFRRATFAALNHYLFNTSRPPFDDRRVREALTLAIDTERLSADTLGGANEPAKKFLPTVSPVTTESSGEERSPDGENAESGEAEEQDASGETAEGDAVGEEDVPAGIRYDIERARRLLAEAGYPGGENFPLIRLLINRNEQQRVVAQAVARMWREGLGVRTEIVMRNWEEYEAMMRAGDFDVARRSVVMQTTDEESNMLALFGDIPTAAQAPTPPSAATSSGAPSTPGAADTFAAAQAKRGAAITTETRALSELPAIPLHFSSSYALVKPYVDGFESNLLDAPSLKHVRINTGWLPPASPLQAGLTRLFPR